jgi:hypothetical protein
VPDQCGRFTFLELPPGVDCGRGKLAILQSRRECNAGGAWRCNAWFWTGARPSEAALSVHDIADQLDVQITDVGSDAIVRTYGALPPDEAANPSSTALLTSAVLLLGLGGVAVVAVRRARTS